MDELAQRSGSDQIRTVEGIMPCLHNSSKSKVAISNPMINAGRLVPNGARIEHTNVDGLCRSSYTVYRAQDTDTILPMDVRMLNDNSVSSDDSR